MNQSPYFSKFFNSTIPNIFTENINPNTQQQPINNQQNGNVKQNVHEQNVIIDSALFDISCTESDSTTTSSSSDDFDSQDDQPNVSIDDNSQFGQHQSQQHPQHQQYLQPQKRTRVDYHDYDDNDIDDENINPNQHDHIDIDSQHSIQSNSTVSTLKSVSKLYHTHIHNIIEHSQHHTQQLPDIQQFQPNKNTNKRCRARNYTDDEKVQIDEELYIEHSAQLDNKPLPNPTLNMNEKNQQQQRQQQQFTHTQLVQYDTILNQHLSSDDQMKLNELQQILNVNKQLKFNLAPTISSIQFPKVTNQYEQQQFKLSTIDPKQLSQQSQQQQPQQSRIHPSTPVQICPGTVGIGYTTTSTQPLQLPLNTGIQKHEYKLYQSIEKQWENGQLSIPTHNNHQFLGKDVILSQYPRIDDDSIVQSNPNDEGIDVSAIDVNQIGDKRVTNGHNSELYEQIRGTVFETATIFDDDNNDTNDNNINQSVQTTNENDTINHTNNHNINDNYNSFAQSDIVGQNDAMIDSFDFDNIFIEGLQDVYGPSISYDDCYNRNGNNGNNGNAININNMQNVDEKMQNNITPHQINSKVNSKDKRKPSQQQLSSQVIETPIDYNDFNQVIDSFNFIQHLIRTKTPSQTTFEMKLNRNYILKQQKHQQQQLLKNDQSDVIMKDASTTSTIESNTISEDTTSSTSIPSTTTAIDTIPPQSNQQQNKKQHKPQTRNNQRALSYLDTTNIMTESRRPQTIPRQTTRRRRGTLLRPKPTTTITTRHQEQLLLERVHTTDLSHGDNDIGNGNNIQVINDPFVMNRANISLQYPSSSIQYTNSSSTTLVKQVSEIFNQIDNGQHNVLSTKMIHNNTNNSNPIDKRPKSLDFYTTGIERSENSKVNRDRRLCKIGAKVAPVHNYDPFAVINTNIAPSMIVHPYQSITQLQTTATTTSTTTNPIFNSPTSIHPKIPHYSHNHILFPTAEQNKLRTQEVNRNNHSKVKKPRFRQIMYDNSFQMNRFPTLTNLRQIQAFRSIGIPRITKQVYSYLKYKLEKENNNQSSNMNNNDITTDNNQNTNSISSNSNNSISNTLSTPLLLPLRSIPSIEQIQQDEIPSQLSQLYQTPQFHRAVGFGPHFKGSSLKYQQLKQQQQQQQHQNTPVSHRKLSTTSTRVLQQLQHQQQSNTTNMFTSQQRKLNQSQKVYNTKYSQSFSRQKRFKQFERLCQSNQQQSDDDIDDDMDNQHHEDDNFHSTQLQNHKQQSNANNNNLNDVSLLSPTLVSSSNRVNNNDNDDNFHQFIKSLRRTSNSSQSSQSSSQSSQSPSQSQSKLQSDEDLSQSSASSSDQYDSSSQYSTPLSQSDSSQQQIATQMIEKDDISTNNNNNSNTTSKLLSTTLSTPLATLLQVQNEYHLARFGHKLKRIHKPPQPTQQSTKKPKSRRRNYNGKRRSVKPVNVQPKTPKYKQEALLNELNSFNIQSHSQFDPISSLIKVKTPLIKQTTRDEKSFQKRCQLSETNQINHVLYRNQQLIQPIEYIHHILSQHIDLLQHELQPHQEELVRHTTASTMNDDGHIDTNQHSQHNHIEEQSTTHDITVDENVSESIYYNDHPLENNDSISADMNDLVPNVTVTGDVNNNNIHTNTNDSNDNDNTNNNLCFSTKLPQPSLTMSVLMKLEQGLNDDNYEYTINKNGVGSIHHANATILHKPSAIFSSKTNNDQQYVHSTQKYGNQNSNNELNQLINSKFTTDQTPASTTTTTTPFLFAPNTTNIITNTTRNKTITNTSLSTPTSMFSPRKQLYEIQHQQKLKHPFQNTIHNNTTNNIVQIDMNNKVSNDNDVNNLNQKYTANKTTTSATTLSIHSTSPQHNATHKSLPITSTINNTQNDPVQLNDQKLHFTQPFIKPIPMNNTNEYNTNTKLTHIVNNKTPLINAQPQLLHSKTPPNIPTSILPSSFHYPASFTKSLITNTNIKSPHSTTPLTKIQFPTTFSAQQQHYGQQSQLQQHLQQKNSQQQHQHLTDENHQPPLNHQQIHYLNQLQSHSNSTSNVNIINNDTSDAIGRSFVQSPLPPLQKPNNNINTQSSTPIATNSTEIFPFRTTKFQPNNRMNQLITEFNQKIESVQSPLRNVIPHNSSNQSDLTNSNDHRMITNTIERHNVAVINKRPKQLFDHQDNIDAPFDNNDDIENSSAIHNSYKQHQQLPLELKQSSIQSNRSSNIGISKHHQQQNQQFKTFPTSDSDLNNCNKQ